MDSIGVSSDEGPRLLEELVPFDGRHPYRSVGRVKYDYVFITATPMERGEEKGRLMQFRLACITAIHPCRDSADLLLRAADETAGVQRRDGELPDCSIPLRIAGRDATGVVIADVMQMKRVKRYDDGTPFDLSVWEGMGKIRKVLKGNFDGLPGGMIPFEIPDAVAGMAQGGAFPYRSVIGMGMVAQPDSQTMVGPWDVPFCSGIEATPANVSEVQRGIADDYDAVTH